MHDVLFIAPIIIMLIAFALPTRTHEAPEAPPQSEAAAIIAALEAGQVARMSEVRS